MTHPVPTLWLTRRRFPFFATLLCAVGLLTPARSTAQDDEAPRGRPNILFLFADDLAYDCVGVSGNEEVMTPQLNRLARQGTRFSHCYNMGAWSGAVCVASRTMLNTGHFVWRAHEAVKKLKSEYVPQRRMWAQRMEDAGYDTYMTGKWHVAADADKIFQNVRHVRPGMPKQQPAGYNRPLGPDDKAWLPWDKSQGGYWKGGKHWSEIVADDAEDFLDQAEESDNPFFMYVAFNAPHDPRQAPESFVRRYPVKEVSLPAPFYPEYPHALSIKSIRDEKLAPYPRSEFAVKTNRAEYYAIINHLDVQIGRILDALATSGKADNTYVIFSADHGLAVGHHGLMGKQNMHDHSLRVPFFIAGPGIPSGITSSEKIYLQDAMATSLDIADVEKPEDVEFHSVLPIVTEQQSSPYQTIYGGYLESQRAIISGNHKLIVYPELNTRLLFDLANDEWEEQDISKEHPDLVEQLTRELEELQVAMDDDVRLIQTQTPQDEQGAKTP